MPQNHEEALEYINQSSFKTLEFFGCHKSFTNKKYNQICKIIAKTYKSCDIFYFTFDKNLKFSKFLNSMCSLKEIEFLSCDFIFEGDIKTNEFTKYS